MFTTQRQVSFHHHLSPSPSSTSAVPFPSGSRHIVVCVYGFGEDFFLCLIPSPFSHTHTPNSCQSVHESDDNSCERVTVSLGNIAQAVTTPWKGGDRRCPSTSCVPDVRSPARRALKNCFSLHQSAKGILGLSYNGLGA